MKVALKEMLAITLSMDVNNITMGFLFYLVKSMWHKRFQKAELCHWIHPYKLNCIHWHSSTPAEHLQRSNRYKIKLVFKSVVTSEKNCQKRKRERNIVFFNPSPINLEVKMKIVRTFFILLNQHSPKSSSYRRFLTSLCFSEYTCI